MEIVSDYLYDALMTKYEAIIPVNNTYLSLTEFNDKDKSGSVMNSDWE